MDKRRALAMILVLLSLMALLIPISAEAAALRVGSRGRRLKPCKPS